MFRVLALVGLAAAAIAAMPSRAVTAEFNAKDGQVLGRTLAFVGDGLSGNTVVGIPFIPASPASRKEAEAVRAVIGDGLSAGRVYLQARLIPIEHLPEVTGIAALYVTSDLGGSMAAIIEAAARLHVPTVSSDLACVQSGTCIIGFSSEPTVQIVIDRASTDRAGVRFMQAFRMLVREK